MRAAVFYESNEPLHIEEIPTPEPGSGEALIKVAACGICHSDLHYLDHGTPTFKKPPLVLGHEPSGTIAALGEGVTGWSEGDRVLLPTLYSCNQCAACRAGRDNICEQKMMLGNNVDGAFAEYILVPANCFFAFPDDLPLEEGAIISDAIMTPYHAVNVRGRVQPGDTVAVFGCGGIGVNVVQMAAVAGAEKVVAVDLSDERLEWARKLGATDVFNPSKEENVDKLVRKVTNGGADIAFECIGRALTQEQAFASTRNGGRLVLVGYSPEKMALNSGRVMYREMDVIGSLGCRMEDFPRVIEMARQGKINFADLVTGRYPLDDINAAFDDLRAAKGVRTIILPGE